MTAPDRRKVASEWMDRASHDWETAVQLIKSGRYHPDVVSTLIQQAMEKYLKGYLISEGWELERTHNLERLCKLASGYDKGFRKYIDLCIVVGDYYMSERYPPLAEEELTEKEVLRAYRSAERFLRFLLKNR